MTSDNERLVLIIWLGIVAPALLLNLFALLVIGCDKTRLGLCLMTSSLATVLCCRHTDTGKFNMETGSTYEYDYASDVKTMMLGASEEHSSLHMTASLHIEVLQKCEMALKVRRHS